MWPTIYELPHPVQKAAPITPGFEHFVHVCTELPFKLAVLVAKVALDLSHQEQWALAFRLPHVVQGTPLPADAALCEA